MKFDLISDVHIDLNKKWKLPEPNPGSNILVIAGDVAEYSGLKNSQFELLRDAALMYKEVLYVLGNHEFYGENYQRCVENIRRRCDIFGSFEGQGKVRVLHGDTFELPDSDIAFVGGTLFTDMNGEDENTIWQIKRMLADFTYITYGGPPAHIGNSQYDLLDDTLALPTPWSAPQETYFDRRIITPRDYVSEWRKFVQYFENECDRLEALGKRVVLVTHHAMSEYSVMPHYALDYVMNGGYRSRMEWFFEKHKNVAVHCHGHMHSKIRYDLWSTKVYCNPFGYQGLDYERNNGYTALQIEV